MILLTILLSACLSGGTPEEADKALDPAILEAASSFLDGSQPQDEESDEKSEESQWKGSVALGGNIQSGNTNTNSFTASANAQLKQGKDRYTIGFNWTYATENGAQTARKTSLSGKYDYFFTEKNYFLAQASGGEDPLAKLQLRYTVGLGAGRQLKNSDEFKLNVEGGLSQVTEDYATPAVLTEGPNPVGPEGFLSARAAYSFDWAINENVSVGQSTEYFSSVDDSEDQLMKIDTHAKVALSEAMFAQAQIVVSWDKSPASDDLTSTDRLFLLTVGWSF